MITSRREEIAWWSQISKFANDVKEEIVKFNDNIQKLKENFEEKFGLSTSRKAIDKEKTKNIKKGLKRKVRTETKLAAETTAKRKVTSTVTKINKFFGHNVQQNNKSSCPLPSFCIRYRSNTELSLFW